MGYANRSRLDDALRLDAQSRRVRFPSGRRWESNPDAYGYGHSNSHTYRDTDGNSYSDGATADDPYTTAASDASASPVAASRKDLKGKLARQTREFLAY